MVLNHSATQHKILSTYSVLRISSEYHTSTKPTKSWGNLQRLKKGWWCIVMVERVWGDGDPPLTPPPPPEGSMGEIKKYISSTKTHTGLPKKELWGNKLLADAEKLLENSQI
ncbi:MAG: hypothetical protein F6K25_10950 [Okeania sp. SIO2G4]|uniref:hypothetical protein n=1 Tax=unclassified Okeania TaxID=2634635 RepID=UPI0013B75244|nr:MULTISPECIES: hypothetical protein [unclassified Okeania]NEP72390.1 hypothetical protein [Okeania sp. SIO2G5]NEP93228.1 hypothetical protein [Okeania sp. SIO2F5]NEQ91198.1 hypothetical protein [Okeania sp. SIO2G4]